MKYKVPFVSNTEDNLHCSQAVKMMILQHFMPKADMEWDEWCDITGYEEGKGTWTSASLLWFLSHGFKVRHVSLFDYQKFADNGASYLIEEYGPDIGSWQVEHTNISKERARTRQLLVSGVVEQREPTTDEIKQLLDDGWLVHVLVNSKKLNGKPGYLGHAILVFGHDKNGFVVHDPGLPPQPNRHVIYDLFEKAWADPGAQAKELDAIKLT